MTLSDARLFDEASAILRRGFDAETAIAATVRNHAESATHAAVIEQRLRAVIERRKAEWTAAAA